MCSNTAIVDSLECYMDDLVGTFEDFVKKSLMIISFGVGTIVVMLVYLLKNVCEPQHLHNLMNENTARSQNEMRNLIVKNDMNTVRQDVQAKERKVVRDRGVSFNSDHEKDMTTANTTSKSFPMPSYDEQILRNIGLSSCSKSIKSRGSNHNNTPTRVPIPTFMSPKYKSIHSLRPSKQNVSASQSYQRTLEKQGSCYPMCCNNKPIAK